METETDFSGDHTVDEDSSSFLRVTEAQKLTLGMHQLSSDLEDANLACNSTANEETESDSKEEIQVNYLYEIDHRKLPPKSPIQLKAIRVVMVAEKTRLSVSATFPSTLSLRKYFSMTNHYELHPELDEQFVMRSNLAKQILTKQISPAQFSEQRHLQSFWCVAPKPIHIYSLPSIKDSKYGPLAKGRCWSALNSCESLRWGVRRRASFMGRHTPRIMCSSKSIKDEKVKEAEALKMEFEDKGEAKKKSKKRRRESLRPNRKAIIIANQDDHQVKSKSLIVKNFGRHKLKNLAYDRWSRERYKSAEVKMMEIMKTKGATFKKPMLRLELRTEARKYIGDTGLLDHLLKHMAGKVTPDGEDRFCRRHNSNGAMEYWLESADLVKIRKEAGVKDPYWTPPPGWVPGDSPSQDPICAREIKFLQKEMSHIKKDVEDLMMLKMAQRNSDIEKADKIATPNKTNSNDDAESESVEPKAVSSLKGIYENLVKKKTQLEQQLVEISNSLNGMQEEFGRLMCSMEVEKDSGKYVEKDKRKMKGESAEMLSRERERDRDREREREREREAKEEEEAGKREKLRSSGFRICKPQGTFLWPNMSVSAGSTIMSPQQQQAQVVLEQQQQQVVIDDTLQLLPTPPSVSSSATNSSPLPLVISKPPTIRPTSPPPVKRPSFTISFPPSSGFQQGNNNINVAAPTNTSYFLNYDRKNHQQNQGGGFSGTSMSSSPSPMEYHQPTPPLLPITVARDHQVQSGGANVTPMRNTYHRKAQRETQQQRASAPAAATWLALATPSPSSL